jgi:hypothetical protein
VALPIYTFHTLYNNIVSIDLYQQITTQNDVRVEYIECLLLQHHVVNIHGTMNCIGSCVPATKTGTHHHVCCTVFSQNSTANGSIQFD